MSLCIIFGGAGFIGTHLAKHLIANKRFDRVHLADIRAPADKIEGVSSSLTDVRNPIPGDLVDEKPEWIFNFAAIHREPGHERHEYFDTNLAGARNVCAYADSVECSNVYFTSSISVYGPTSTATDETSPICPNSPYGGSKYPAEVIHEAWLAGGSGKRLVICRPGVVYGPGDPGNMLRMITAVRRGYFAYPGSPDLFKSYAYIYGLLDSIDFVMGRDDSLITYNYVETPTEPLGELVRQTKAFVGSNAPVFRIPTMLLTPAAALAQLIVGPKNPIHPVRVRKAAMSTHIIPRVLQDMGFEFRYPFLKSVEHWQSVTPADFES